MSKLHRLSRGYVKHRKDYCESCLFKQSESGIRDEDGFLIRRERKGNYLTVHHIDHNPLNNSSDNLQTLCAICHSELHRKEDIFKNFVNKKTEWNSLANEQYESNYNN